MAAALLGLYLFLNRRLLGACARHDPRFLLTAIGMTALYYVYATLGAAIGLLLELARPRRSMGPTTPKRRPAPIVGAA